MNGGRTPTGRDAVEWAREGVERGAGEILLTSMDRDGTEDGYELELTRAVADAVDVPVIASGGAGTLDHLVEAVEEGGADAVLCASIFHYGQLHGARGQGAHARGRHPGAPLTSTARDGQADLRERVRRLPGMERLLPALEGLPPAYLVGGAVRDLLRGRRRRRPRPRGRGRRALGRPRAGRAARRRARREHERFGTATVGAARARVRPRRRPGGRPTTQPGALPRVSSPRRWARTSAGATSRSTRWRSGSPATTSATCTTRTAGWPTSSRRRARAARAQLPRRPDAAAARAALRGAARLRAWTRTPSGSPARRWPADALSHRLGRAHRATSCWTCWPSRTRRAAVARMRELGVDRAPAPGSSTPTPSSWRRPRWAPCAIGADRALAALAALDRARRPSSSTCGSATSHLRAEERDAVSRAARVGAAASRGAAQREHAPSELHALLGREPPEALALALALGAPAEPILRWVADLRPRPARDHRRTTCSPPASPRARRSAARSRRRCGASSTARFGPRRGAARRRWSCCAIERAMRSRAARAPGRSSRPATGGVSEGPYESLNLGILTDDDPERVTENRRRAGRAGRRRGRARGDGLAGARHRRLRSGTAPPPDRALRDAGRRTCEGRRPHHPRARARPARAGGRLLAGGARGGEQVAMLHCGWRGLAGGIIAKALAPLRRAARRRGRARHRRLLLRGRATRCWTAFADIEGVADGRHARPAGRDRAPARARPASTESSTSTCARAAAPDLFFSHRRDGGVTGRQAG